MKPARLVAAALALAALPGFAGELADSSGDYSLVQGTGGWRYGFVAGDAGLPPTSVAGFVEFDTVSTGRWVASASQVGAQNATFLQLGPD